MTKQETKEICECKGIYAGMTRMEFEVFSPLYYLMSYYEYKRHMHTCKLYGIKQMEVKNEKYNK